MTRDIEKKRAYDRQYDKLRTNCNAKPERVAYRRAYNNKYRQSPEAKINDAKRHRVFYKNHPEVGHAHNIARNIPLGPECEWCGSTENLQRAHFDYSKPKLFLTLCRRCHAKIDSFIRYFNHPPIDMSKSGQQIR
jgi:hypothetical protein